MKAYHVHTSFPRNMDTSYVHSWFILYSQLKQKSVDIGFVKAFISINKRQSHNEPITDQKSKLDLLKTSFKKIVINTLGC